MQKQFFVKKCFQMIAVLMMAIIFSCKAQEDQSKTKNLRTGAVDVYGDRNKCIYSGQPGNTTPYPLSGIWDSLDWQETDLLRFTYSYEFALIGGSTVDYTIKFISYCTHKETNRTAIAIASTIATDSVKNFEIIQGKYTEKTEKFGEVEVSCDSEAKAGFYQYKFHGNCLVVNGQYFTRRHLSQ